MKFSYALLSTIKVLLVVICTLFVISILILPNVVRRHSLESANRTRLVANGVGIYKSIMAEYEDTRIYSTETTLAFPLSATKDTEDALEFSNSTDYFAYLVKSEILAVNWSFFAALKVPAAPGKYDPYHPDESLESFKPENNAWCVVADLSMEQNWTPFLITKNLQASQLKASYAEDDAPTVKGPPYEDEAIVIIRMGGSGEVMRERNILWKNLNPNKAANSILRP
ncbi:hypothetical protein P3T73_16420 [Kiritimatiellota bacterium B12222]|nr:hypothetical protein P3T73_16420 [Kiritimatiellota bacterium B12222]